MLNPYVEGRWCIVGTDQQSLKWICDLRKSIGPLQRWKLHLGEPDFEVQH